MQSPTISVVITTYNRRERLAETLKPLLAENSALEIVVVDDASSDSTAEMLTLLARTQPRLRPIILPVNCGQPRARAIGVEAARGDLVLSLDDDVQARAGLVAGHRQRHTQGAKRVVLGYMPTVLPAPRRPGQFATHHYAKTYEYHIRRYEADSTTIFTNFWAGNFSVARSDFLAAVESYDSHLPYHEDRDLGLRFLRAGLEPVFDRTLLAEHWHERSLAAFVREGRNSAEAERWLHTVHADLLGPFSLQGGSLWRRLHTRVALTLGIRPVVRQGTYAVLPLLIRAAGTLHLFAVEERLAWLLRELEWFRAATTVEKSDSN